MPKFKVQSSTRRQSPATMSSVSKQQTTSRPSNLSSVALQTSPTTSLPSTSTFSKVNLSINGKQFPNLTERIKYLQPGKPNNKSNESKGEKSMPNLLPKQTGQNSVRTTMLTSSTDTGIFKFSKITSSHIDGTTETTTTGLFQPSLSKEMIKQHANTREVPEITLIPSLGRLAEEKQKKPQQTTNNSDWSITLPTKTTIWTTNSTDEYILITQNSSTDISKTKSKEQSTDEIKITPTCDPIPPISFKTRTMTSPISTLKNLILTSKSNNSIKDGLTLTVKSNVIEKLSSGVRSSTGDRRTPTVLEQQDGRHVHEQIDINPKVTAVINGRRSTWQNTVTPTYSHDNFRNKPNSNRNSYSNEVLIGISTFPTIKQVASFRPIELSSAVLNQKTSKFDKVLLESVTSGYSHRALTELYGATVIPSTTETLKTNMVNLYPGNGGPKKLERSIGGECDNCMNTTLVSNATTINLHAAETTTQSRDEAEFNRTVNTFEKNARHMVGGELTLIQPTTGFTPFPPLRATERPTANITLTSDKVFAGSTKQNGIQTGQTYSDTTAQLSTTSASGGDHSGPISYKTDGSTIIRPIGSTSDSIKRIVSDSLNNATFRDVNDATLDNRYDRLGNGLIATSANDATSEYIGWRNTTESVINDPLNGSFSSNATSTENSTIRTQTQERTAHDHLNASISGSTVNITVDNNMIVSRVYDPLNGSISSNATSTENSTIDIRTPRREAYDPINVSINGNTLNVTVDNSMTESTVYDRLSESINDNVTSTENNMVDIRTIGRRSYDPLNGSISSMINNAVNETALPLTNTSLETAWTRVAGLRSATSLPRDLSSMLKKLKFESFANTLTTQTSVHRASTTQMAPKIRIQTVKQQTASQKKSTSAPTSLRSKSRTITLVVKSELKTRARSLPVTDSPSSLGRSTESLDPESTVSTDVDHQKETVQMLGKSLNKSHDVSSIVDRRLIGLPAQSFFDQEDKETTYSKGVKKTSEVRGSISSQRTNPDRENEHNSSVFDPSVQKTIDENKPAENTTSAKVRVPTKKTAYHNDVRGSEIVNKLTYSQPTRNLRRLLIDPKENVQNNNTLGLRIGNSTTNKETHFRYTRIFQKGDKYRNQYHKPVGSTEHLVDDTFSEKRQSRMNLHKPTDPRHHQSHNHHSSIASTDDVKLYNRHTCLGLCRLFPKQSVVADNRSIQMVAARTMDSHMDTVFNRMLFAGWQTALRKVAHRSSVQNKRTETKEGEKLRYIDQRNYGYGVSQQKRMLNNTPFGINEDRNKDSLGLLNNTMYSMVKTTLESDQTAIGPTLNTGERLWRVGDLYRLSPSGDRITPVSSSDYIYPLTHHAKTAI